MKRIVTAIVAVLIIGAGVLAAIPFVVSSNTVRTGITSKIEAFTGRKVTFQGNPSLSFNPFLGFEISDLVLVDLSRGEADTPLLRVEKVKAQLDIIPLLSGKIEVTEYQFLRPRFELKTFTDGSKNWEFDKGGFNEAIQATITNRANQTDDLLPETKIGGLEIINGIMIYDDEIAGTSETVTSINGKFLWPNTNSDINISGNGIWRGEGITTLSNLKDPIKILSGGESQAFVEINSQPLKFKFDGQANMFADLFVKGDLAANTPSISRLAEVLKFDIGEFSSFENWSAVGKFESTANSTVLSDATFNIGDSSASGVVRVSTDELGKSKLDGTLAFEEIDLADYFNSTGLTNSNKNKPNLINGLNVDLRISSQSINIGQINLDNVAAAINIDNEGWILDIGDASAFNEKMVAKLGERISENKQQAFLDISASDVDAENIAGLFGKKLVGISGKTSFIANVRTNKLTDGFINSGLNGTFTGDFNSGDITGVNLPKLMTQKTEEGQLEIDGFDETTSTSFDEMKIKLFLNNGIAAVTQSTIQTTNNMSLQAIGDINLYEGSLDLQFQEIGEDGPKENRLIINGSTINPSVTLQSGPTSVNQN